MIGTESATSSQLPRFAEAVRLWAKIGCLSFGGPAGQIALLHRETVEDRKWISNQRFMQALNFCTLLPGPEAQQLAIYLGWLLHGVKGGMAAGLLFILPGAVVMLGLSVLYVEAGTIPLIAALLFGLKCTVLVLVAQAVLRLGRRALAGALAVALAGLSFIGLFFFNLPFPVIVAIAFCTGFALPGHFGGTKTAQNAAAPVALLDTVFLADPGRLGRMAVHARWAALAAGIAWLLPVLLLLGGGGVYGDIARLFTKMAVVTFGGAYAVLAYATQEAVSRYHWLSAADMLTGLGLAETTPGPLILVLQFIGFMAGYRAAAGGIASGLIASLVTLWVLFAPCFAMVFLGAPWIENLQSRPSLSGALAAITAAVVGVIANLGVWLVIHTLFQSVIPLHWGGLAFDLPLLNSLDWAGLALTLLAGITILRLNWGVVPTLILSAAASMAAYALR